MYVFEGPDCVGKSTLIQKISDELIVPIKKCVPIDEDFNKLASVIGDIQEQRIRNEINRHKSEKEIILYDRWPFISDIVYSSIQDKKSIFVDLIPYFTKILWETNIVIFYVDCSKEDLNLRYNNRNDNMWGLCELFDIQEKYKEFFDKMKVQWPIIKINTSNMTERDFNNIINIIYK